RRVLPLRRSRGHRARLSEPAPPQPRGDGDRGRTPRHSFRRGEDQRLLHLLVADPTVAESLPNLWNAERPPAGRRLAHPAEDPRRPFQELRGQAPPPAASRRPMPAKPGTEPPAFLEARLPHEIGHEKPHPGVS